MGNYIPRLAETLVREALSDTPVVLIHGPRQAGKSTLALEVGRATGARYVTLDDPVPRALAIEDPQGFVAAYSGPVIIDEVQRAPGLFLAIKAAVDRDRTSGRFLLTGSANVLSLPKIADSLAGRMAIVDLLPLSQAEIDGGKATFIDSLFSQKLRATSIGQRAGNFEPSTAENLIGRLLKGGFPEPMARASQARRDAWFGDYIRTLLERDVRGLANIEGLTQMPRVLKLIAARVGSPINVLDLSRDTQIPNTSLHRYLELLEAIFLAQSVRAWSADLGVRLAKTAKTYLVDSGLLGYLRNISPAALGDDPDVLAPMLENFVATELGKLAPVSEARPDIYHLRTVRRLEVDFVLEDRSGRVAGIQVRARPTVRPEDAEGLCLLRDLSVERFCSGTVLYLGADEIPMGEDIWALPISAVWTATPTAPTP